MMTNKISPDFIGDNPETMNVGTICPINNPVSIKDENHKGVRNNCSMPEKVCDDIEHCSQDTVYVPKDIQDKILKDISIKYPIEIVDMKTDTTIPYFNYENILEAIQKAYSEGVNSIKNKEGIKLWTNEDLRNAMRQGKEKQEMIKEFEDEI